MLAALQQAGYVRSAAAADVESLLVAADGQVFERPLRQYRMVPCVHAPYHIPSENARGPAGVAVEFAFEAHSHIVRLTTKI